MAPGPNYGTCQQIVETRPGPGTGETRYRTADGRWWRETDAHADTTMGTQTAYLHGSHICQHR